MGCLIVCMVLAEMHVIAKTSALTLTVAGTVREVFAIAVAGHVFHEKLSAINVRRKPAQTSPVAPKCAQSPHCRRLRAALCCRHASYSSPMIRAGLGQVLGIAICLLATNLYAVFKIRGMPHSHAHRPHRSWETAQHRSCNGITHQQQHRRGM